MSKPSDRKANYTLVESSKRKNKETDENLEHNEAQYAKSGSVDDLKSQAKFSNESSLPSSNEKILDLNSTHGSEEDTSSESDDLDEEACSAMTALSIMCNSGEANTIKRSDEHNTIRIVRSSPVRNNQFRAPATSSTSPPTSGPLASSPRWPMPSPQFMAPRATPYVVSAHASTKSKNAQRSREKANDKSSHTESDEETTDSRYGDAAIVAMVSKCDIDNTTK